MNVFDMVSLTKNDILKLSFDSGRYKPLKWYGIKPTPVSRPFEEWDKASTEMLMLWENMENSIVNGAIDIQNIETGKILKRVNCRALTIVERGSMDD